MTFSEHIRTRVFGPRLKESRILVVFDPEERYADICQSMDSSNCTVIDTRAHPLTARFDAMRRWQELCADTTHTSQLLIYCRDPAPANEEDQIAHPYSAFVAMGARFPDGAKDDYQQICISFLPQRRTEIAQLFEGAEPPALQHIDTLAGGDQALPRLEAIFGTGEVTSIVKGFLVPTDATASQLEASADWLPELTGLLGRIFGFQIGSKVTNPDTIRAKLWQFLLFSEFADDLPGPVPENLAGVPTAEKNAIPLIYSLCESLRQSPTREAYRDAALTVEKELALPDECEDISDLGRCDTFAFEEARYLRHAATCVQAGDLDQAEKILAVHEKSLWADEGERQLLWRILRLALEMLNAIEIAAQELGHRGPSGAELVQLYDEKLCRVDRLQRELDTALLQIADGLDEVEAIAGLAHQKYEVFANELQGSFLPDVEREGWPLSGLQANQNTYRDRIAPAILEGKKVAYFLTDALRLELAQQLGESLGKQYDAKVESVCAQLPCITRFGMASLLPEAGDNLRFQEEKGGLEPYLDNVAVALRADRLEAFEKQAGSQYQSFALREFVDQTRTPAKRETMQKRLEDIHLLVITSTEIDSLGEGDDWLRQHLAEPLGLLLRAVRRCAELGFDLAVIATDHGFLWVEGHDSGNTCAKPIGGEWLVSKRRCHIGTGDEPHGSIKLATAAVGIPCDAPSFIVPRGIAVYEKGSSYYHEGLSLQESVVGRITVNIAKSADTGEAAPEATSLELTRKRKKVASVIVSCNLSWPGTGLLFEAAVQEFELRAVQKGEVVGRPVASDHVDPATNRVKLAPGSSIKINLRLDATVEEGPLKVQALDPKTDKVLASLDLDYSPTVI